MDNKLVNRAWALYRSAEIFAKETDKSVNVAVRNNDQGRQDGFVTIGDYDFCVYPEGSRQINYNPNGDYDKDKEIRNVDPERIISYTEPPKEKSPDTDQSEQGMSVDNNAQPHNTPKGGEGQDER